MSWLFGYKTPQPPPEMAPGANIPSAGGTGGSGADDERAKLENKKMEAYRFDSTALERAAKAAKDLEKSRKYT